MGLPTVNIINRIGLALTLALIPLAAFGQSQTVRQSGPVTQRHVTIWNSNGVVQDGGTAADSLLSTLGIVSNQPSSLCISSDHASAASRQQLCLGVTSNGPATISIQNYGTAPASNIQFIINGVAATFPTTINPVSGAVTCFNNALQLTSCTNTTGTGNIVFDNGATINNANINNSVLDNATITLATPLPIGSGGTGASTIAGAQTNLGLGSMATQTASNVNITGGTVSLSTPLAIASGGSGSNTASGARSNFGLGTIATQNASGVSISGGAITGMPSPTNATDVAIKSYVDSVASGFTPLAASNLATTTALPANTYANGALGVGATLTASGNGALTVDSVGVVNGNRVLVKNEATASHNGIYTVTAAGDAGNPYVLTRATDFDQAAEMKAGSQTFIISGTVNTNSTYALLTTVGVVGTDPVNFVQTSQFSIGPNSISLSNLVQIGADTTLCNPTGITANVTACSQTQLTALVNPVTSSLSGAVPATGGNGAQFLAGDVTFKAVTLGAIALTTNHIVVGSASVATDVAMSGDCTIVSSGAISCTIPLNHLATQVNNTSVCNVSGGVAAPIACTTAQTTTLINAFTTTLSGAVPAPGSVSGKVLTDNGTWQAAAGTVSSVGLAMPGMFSVSGSPVTGSGTLTATLTTQSANQAFMGPSSGSAVAPTFRAMVHDDMPTSIHTQFYVACDGTGVSDCSSSINTALSNCATAKGGVVRISAGKVLVNSGIVFPAGSGGCVLQGAGIYQEYGGTFASPTVPTNGTVLWQTSTTNPKITVPQGLQMVAIRDFSFSENQPADTVGWTPTVYQPSILLQGGTGNSAGQVYIEHNQCYGVYACIQIGADAQPTGRTTVRDLTGMCFYQCIDGRFAADVTWFDHIQCYPFVPGSHIQAYVELVAVCIGMRRLDAPFFTNINNLGHAYGFFITPGAGDPGTQDSGAIKIVNYRSESARFGLYSQGCNTIQGSNWDIGGQDNLNPGHAVANSIGIDLPGNTCTVTTDGGPFLDVTNIMMYFFDQYCVAANPIDISFNNIRCWNYNQANGGFVGMIANAGASIGVTGRMAFDTASSHGAAATGGAGTFHTISTY